MSVSAVHRSRPGEGSVATESASAERAATRRNPAAAIAVTSGSRSIQATLAGPSAAQLRQRLEEFQHKMGGPYTLGGREVFVAPPFRMIGGDGQLEPGQYVQRLARALGPEGYRKIARDVGDVVVGKGSPEALKRVTQALIDSPAFARYRTQPPEAGIRRMMWDHGLGMDCSGYVHHAFLASRNAPASRYGLNTAVQSGIQRPPAALFRNVSPRDARPGDVMRLGPPNNQHKVIVVDRRELQPSDELHARIGAELGSAPGARLLVFEVDSSWGAGGKPENGGVGRRVWAYDDGTKRWASLIPADRGAWHVFASNASGPYDHTLLGIHRPRSER
jgi:cell wall-associated NlpC family hydrolase